MKWQLPALELLLELALNSPQLGLGLPALGAALVTRFPFSIPWDVVKGIKLVAAPAEAPRWEVDFLAPISGRVGGWKGSTKVVIDMGVYPIIGQDVHDRLLPDLGLRYKEADLDSVRQFQRCSVAAEDFL